MPSSGTVLYYIIDTFENSILRIHVCLFLGYMDLISKCEGSFPKVTQICRLQYGI
jgi:hypothetical protein